MIEYFSTIRESLSEMNFLETLNPLYALPIIAVIVCMLIVYTFGFKSPVQPPSFERIEDDSKVAKKRKAKETSKKEQGKIAQNGKVNGNKPKSPGKKKDEKPIEKKEAPVEKKEKPSKKKSHSENKAVSEKPKIIPNEEIPEDGWVQLVSKKQARKNKKDEAVSAESVLSNESVIKQSTDVKNDFQEKAFEKLSAKKNILNENSDVKKTLNIPLEVTVTQDIAVPQETILNSHVIPEAEKIENVKNANQETSLTKLKADDKSSNKSRKKKKNVEEKVNNNQELQNKLVIEPEDKVEKPSTVEVPIESPAENKAPLVSNANQLEENVEKEPKTSNVAFDEMEGLYPQAKEPKKKKKVRREH